MSTSSLTSVGEETRKGGGAVSVQASRRATTVRFAPPPLSPVMKASSGPVSHSHSALAMARLATASGARPGSASGTRCRTPAGRLPDPAGPKAMRRSWGWTAGELDAKEPASSNPVVAKVVAAKTHSRSSSVSLSETSVLFFRILKRFAHHCKFTLAIVSHDLFQLQCARV